LGKKIELFSQALGWRVLNHSSNNPKTAEATLQVQPGRFKDLPKQHFPHFNNMQLMPVWKMRPNVYVGSLVVVPLGGNMVCSVVPRCRFEESNQGD